MPKAKILVADDNAEMRELMCDGLREEGYEVLGVSDGGNVVIQAKNSSPDLILTDLRMPDGGMDLLSHVRVLLPTAVIVLMTAFADRQTEAEGFRNGAAACLAKPVHLDVLKSTIAQLLFPYV